MRDDEQQLLNTKAQSTTTPANAPGASGAAAGTSRQFSNQLRSPPQGRFNSSGGAYNNSGLSAYMPAGVAGRKRGRD